MMDAQESREAFDALAERVAAGSRRIIVGGTSGSGKTTMARRLAEILGLTHVELDALHWEPNWTEAPAPVLRERVAAALSAPGWTICGNYGSVRDLVWSRADTVIWLDYPLPVIMSRLLRRTARRVITQEELWSGNRERLWAQLSPDDSIIVWALKTYRRRRREYRALLSQPENAHLTVVHLQSPRVADRWLARVEQAAARR
jgi:adenylate kinase family enzyme